MLRSRLNRNFHLRFSRERSKSTETLAVIAIRHYTKQMSIETIRQFIKEKAEQFGAKTEIEFNKPYVERNNTGQEALKDNGAYFGFIHPEEEASGPFHDFSK